VPVPQSWTAVSAAQLRLSALGLQTLYAPATSEGLLPWIYGEGGALIDPDAKKILVNQAPAVAGLQTRLTMQGKGVTVDDSSADSVDKMRAEFREGKVAMILDDADALPGLVGGSAFPTRSAIGIAPVPTGSLKSSSPLSGTDYVVYAGTKDADSAEKLVAFLDSPSSQATLAEELGLLPTRVSAYTEADLVGNTVVQGFEPVIRTGTPLPVAPSNAQLYPPLDESFRAALAGQSSAQVALDDVASAYRKSFPDYSVTLPK
jgi:arabinogalactan oligomer / maltooligosaccharide transport system substrate-binding protein